MSEIIKKSYSKRIIIFISVLIGLGALWYIFDKIPIGQVISIFKGVTILQISFYIILQFVMFYTLTFRWKLILRSQNIKDVDLFSLTNYKVVGYAVSFLTPTAKIGGEPVRAALLSNRHDIPFDKALSSVVIDKTLELTTSASFFVIGALILLMSFVVDPNLRYWIIGVSLFFIIVFGIFNYRMMSGKTFFLKLFNILGFNKIKKFKKFAKKLKNFERLVIKFYHKDKRFFFQAVLVSALSWILMFFEYSIAGSMLGQDLSPMQIFLIFSFVGAAYLIPIPMALGSLEASQISVFNILKIGSATGVAISLIIRLKDIIISVIGLLMLTVYGFKLKEVVKEANRLDKQVEKLNIMKSKAKNQ